MDLPLSFSGYFVKGCLELTNTTYALAFLSSNKDPSSTCHHVGKSTALLQPLARPETNKTIPMAIQCTLWAPACSCRWATSSLSARSAPACCRECATATPCGHTLLCVHTKRHTSLIVRRCSDLWKFYQADLVSRVWGSWVVVEVPETSEDPTQSIHPEAHTAFGRDIIYSILLIFIYYI